MDKKVFSSYNDQILNAIVDDILTIVHKNDGHEKFFNQKRAISLIQDICDQFDLDFWVW